MGHSRVYAMMTISRNGLTLVQPIRKGCTRAPFPPSREVQEDIPKTLLRGWRLSTRNESWYRKRGGWVAIIIVDVAGYRVVLRRTVRTFDDALDIANEVLE